MVLILKIGNHISTNIGNRSRTEIVSNILDAANGGATKTKIMYFTFLSYNLLYEYPFNFDRRQSNNI